MSHLSATSTVVVRPPARFPVPEIGELWANRAVLWVLVWRNVTQRYRQTLLGPTWFIINPLMRMAVFSVLLGNLAGLPSDGVPYPLFTYAALLPWELFATGVERGMKCLVSYHHIISKVYFPRLLLPTAEVLTALVDFSLSFGILLLMMLAYGFDFAPRIFLLPIFLSWGMIMALGVGLMMGPVHAHFRDAGNAAQYLVQFWFYGTPVAYSASLVTDRIPGWAVWLYQFNPLNAVVEGCRWALLGTGRAPDVMMIWSLLFSLLVLAIGTLVFLRAEQSVVDLV
ncbi:MAG: ABC transporter permease [Gemmatimonadetes bacterium]|nr:ABC transporter permease [Gemmatimonadota bacterium]